MQEHSTSETSPLSVSRDGVLVIEGFGLRLAVHGGHLQVTSGSGADIRGASFPRASRKLHRIVLIGRGGSVTLDALRWMDDVGIRFFHVEPDGRMLAASGRLSLDHPALRRAQALAASTTSGVEITRWILS